jgi:hypothetical protein
METDPEYNVDICAPENRTPSNVELCRIINPGPPLAHKIPKLLSRKKKGGKRRTRRRKTQRKNRRSRRR